MLPLLTVPPAARLGVLAIPSALALHRLLLVRARRRVGSAHRRVIRAIDAAAEPPTDSVSAAAAAAASATSSVTFPTSTSQTTRDDLPAAEAKLVRARRRVRLLRWEQRALLSDALFVFYEALRPERDKQVVESLTGMLSSVIRIGVLCA